MKLEGASIVYNILFLGLVASVNALESPEPTGNAVIPIGSVPTQYVAEFVHNCSWNSSRAANIRITFISNATGETADIFNMRDNYTAPDYLVQLSPSSLVGGRFMRLTLRLSVPAEFYHAGIYCMSVKGSSIPCVMVNVADRLCCERVDGTDRVLSSVRYAGFMPFTVSTADEVHCNTSVHEVDRINRTGTIIQIQQVSTLCPLTAGNRTVVRFSAKIKPTDVSLTAKQIRIRSVLLNVPKYNDSTTYLRILPAASTDYAVDITEESQDFPVIPALTFVTSTIVIGIGSSGFAFSRNGGLQMNNYSPF